MQITDDMVIYQDNHLIAINKPAGLLVQPDTESTDSLEESTKTYLAHKFNKPGAAFLGIIHRIDRPVSGLVLMAKTSKALTRMNEAFKSRTVEKTYYAIVRAQPPAHSGTLQHYLTKNQKNNIVTAHNQPVTGSQQAKLSYSVLGTVNGYFMLQVTPVTGRSHQIRVQLAAMGCPIVGDNKYGYPRGSKAGYICLHSRSLAFSHPVTQQQLTLLAELPYTDFWQKFKNL